MLEATYTDPNALVLGLVEGKWFPGFFTGMRGKLLFRAGRIDEAIPDLERAVADVADHKEVDEEFFVLAMAYQQCGRREDAKRMFTRGCAVLEELDLASKGPRNWHDRTITNFLRKEAAAVLGM